MQSHGHYQIAVGQSQDPRNGEQIQMCLCEWMIPLITDVADTNRSVLHSSTTYKMHKTTHLFNCWHHWGVAGIRVAISKVKPPHLSNFGQVLVHTLYLGRPKQIAIYIQISVSPYRVSSPIKF
jgi:hypothetical protein